MVKKLIVALILGITAITGIGMASASAGNPCYVQGADQGWYWNGNKVNQCVQDANRVLIRQYGAGGVDEGIVLDTWMPGSTYYWITADQPYGGGAVFAACPTTWVGTHTILTNNSAPMPPGWEQKYKWFNNDGTQFEAGAINHWFNFPGTQGYGGYRHLVTGNCPYGGNATIFYPG